jgi:hypothetical protein
MNNLQYRTCSSEAFDFWRAVGFTPNVIAPYANFNADLNDLRRVDHLSQPNVVDLIGNRRCASIWMAIVCDHQNHPNRLSIGWNRSPVVLLVD